MRFHDFRHSVTSPVCAALLMMACRETPSSDATREQTGGLTSNTGETEATPERISLHGAGATFPYPLYSRWAHAYKKATGVEINYQSIGSGGGIAQIKAKTVDFGATDAPLTQEELDSDGLIQFPLVVGGVVPVVNLDGVKGGSVKLTSTLIADIFMGKIVRWRDPAIVKINPDVPLPDREIVVVHRADGSGTTWIFTNYLSKVSPEWRERVGNARAVKWPVGMGGKGNEGVAAYVQRVPGAIGYVEFAYALQNEMTHVSLQNREGTFVAPTADTFYAASTNADWKRAEGFYVVLTDQAGEQSWPITGASFILLHKVQPNLREATAALKFFDFCYRKGAADAEALHYVPMPESVTELVYALWISELTSDGKPVWE